MERFDDSCKTFYPGQIQGCLAIVVLGGEVCPGTNEEFRCLDVSFPHCDMERRITAAWLFGVDVGPGGNKLCDDLGARVLIHIRFAVRGHVKYGGTIRGADIDIGSMSDQKINQRSLTGIDRRIYRGRARSRMEIDIGTVGNEQFDNFLVPIECRFAQSPSGSPVGAIHSIDFDPCRD
jgi:hypothetical protein